MKLLFLGGKFKGKVEEWSKAGKMTEHVHAAGQVVHDDISIYLQNSDLYISCSPSDGTSVTMLEAFACGLPVLVSDIPGNRDWVREDQNGWLVPVGDPEEVARQLVKISRESPDLLLTMGRTNRRVAEERANWERNVQYLVQAYDRLTDMAKTA